MMGSTIEPTLNALTNGIASVVRRLGKAEAAKTCGRVAGIMTSSLEREEDDGRRFLLASSLASIADCMSPDEASRVSDEAIGVLLRARSDEPQNRDSIDESVATLIRRVNSQIASKRLCDLSTLMIAGSTSGGKYLGRGGMINKK